MPRLRITIRDLLEDIRAGMTDAALMTKYNLSSQGLASAFNKLLESKAITKAEIDWRPTEYYDTVVLDSVREYERIDVRFHLPIIDEDDPQTQGTVEDISLGGVRVKGIETKVNEKRRFILLADQLARVDPIVFEARCRWFSGGNDGVCSAGFQITDISQDCLEDLRRLIKAFCVER